MVHVVVHYDEIALKGANRGLFEQKLLDNIKIKLKEDLIDSKREWGHILLEVKDYSKLNKIPGIAFFVPAEKCDLDLEDIKKTTEQVLSTKTYETFRISAVRHNKDFPINSMELDKLVGEHMFNKGKKVSLKNADVDVKIEICDKEAYIGTERINGISGLPTNPRQKIIGLLSGGFDSPVASYLMMKRGCEVIFVHFHNKNAMQDAVQDKIKKLVNELSKYQVKSKLYIVPFEELQAEIIKSIKSEDRMLIYRRFMLRIAAKISEQEKAFGLVLGDSLSQVASQTVDNLQAVYAAVDKLILTPLIGMNKQEIVDLSKAIGTYSISELPYGDCCSYFIPKHPNIRGNAEKLAKLEDGLDVEGLVRNALSKVEEFNS